MPKVLDQTKGPRGVDFSINQIANSFGGSNENTTTKKTAKGLPEKEGSRKFSEGLKALVEKWDKLNIGKKPIIKSKVTPMDEGKYNDQLSQVFDDVKDYLQGKPVSKEGEELIDTEFYKHSKLGDVMNLKKFEKLGALVWKELMMEGQNKTAAIGGGKLNAKSIAKLLGLLGVGTVAGMGGAEAMGMDTPMGDVDWQGQFDNITGQVGDYANAALETGQDIFNTGKDAVSDLLGDMGFDTGISETPGMSMMPEEPNQSMADSSDYYVDDVLSKIY